MKISKNKNKNKKSRCHVAHSMAGVVVMDDSKLGVRNSIIEKIWFGAAVAAHARSLVRTVH